MKTFRKFLSVLVTACLLISSLPMTAFAADANVEIDTTTKPGTIYVYANGRHIRVKPDGIYDLYSDVLLSKINSSTINGGIFGGAKSGNVASTKVVVANGAAPGKVWGGCWSGNVSGSSQVIIEEGGTVGTLYGGGNTIGTVGSSYVEVNKNAGTITTLYAGGNYASTSGNITLVLNNARIAGMGGGSNGGGVNSGDIDITVNNSTITGNFYGGGGGGSSVEGSVNIKIYGATTIATETGKVFQPMCKSSDEGGARVAGDVSVYIPRNFAQKDSIQRNSGIFIFYNDGEQIYGPPTISTDMLNKNIFSNGLTVTIKTYASDGNTYLYDHTGEKQLLMFPIDDYKIYGGSTAQTVKNTSITMESGRVAAIYGSGSNGSVSSASYIKVNEGATVTGSVYSSSSSASVNSSVIWVGNSFSLDKIQPSQNARIFKGSIELANTGITVEKQVYKKDNYVFANGIPIVVKKDITDGRTYVYDAAGTTKLLATAVNGMEIYGGSYQGVVADTNVRMESGTVTRIYGGGYTSCVSGIARVTVTGGDITEVIYGGSYDGDVGGTEINVTGPYVAKAINGGSRNGCVTGATKVSLKDSATKGLYAGTGGDGRGKFYPASDVLGNVSINMDGGMAESIYGGCKSGLVHGNSVINITGNTIIKSLISAEGKGGVNGISTVNTPSGFTYPQTIPQKELVKTRNPDVFATAEDNGKLVFRFIDIPEPSGNYIVSRPGEAFFITFPNGENMLVDAGANTESSQKAITDFLDSMGITKINNAVITHYHADHDGRTAFILNNYNVDKLYTTAFTVPQKEEYSANIKNWMDSNTSKVEYLWRNDKFNIGDVQFEVLNPPESNSVKATMNGDPSAEECNNNSIVMKITYGVNTALLAGDLYIAAEKELLAAYAATPDKLKADLVKVPHHGDTTSSDPEFVQAVAPDTAVFTHFCNTVIVNNRYREAGANTFVTGEDGVIKLSYDGKTKAPVAKTEYYVPEPAAINVTGGADIIYVDSTRKTVTSYTYSIQDQYGKGITNAVAAVTITDDNGSLINDPALSFSDNTLTVTGKPAVSYAVVNYTYAGLKASKRTVFADTPLLTVSPESISTYYNSPAFSLTLTSDSYADNIVTKLVNGELTSTMNSYLYKTGLPEGTKLSLIFDNGRFKVVKKINGTSTELNSSDTGIYTAYIFFPELNLQGAFTLKIISPSSGSGWVPPPAAPATQAPTPTPAPTPAPTTSPDSTVFSDVQNHWADKYIYTLAHKGIILGKGDNKFDPEGEITRGEFIAAIVRAFKLSESAKAVFSDVPGDAWYAGYINAAYAAGIVSGKGDGSFAPEALITREEMAVIASRLYRLMKGAEISGNAAAAFTDTAEISQWATEDVAVLYQLGLIKGSDGAFAPKSYLTRAEGVTILYNLLVKLSMLEK